ncbi:MAG: mercury(II) reductase [Armatimonadota bacterium]
MTDQYDLVILGSGSTAFAAALRAREFGKTVVMTEERTLGGTCVNRGCLPSKNLIDAARIIHEARSPRYPGLRPCPIPFDFATLVQQKDEIVHAYRHQKYTRVLGDETQVEYGHAQFADPHTITVDGRLLRGKAVLIATGSRPVIPRIDGLDQVAYLTSDLLTSNEGMELTTLPSSLVIIGGGYIAMELGQLFRRFGTEVTILERSGQLLAHGYEPDIGQYMASVFTDEDIHVVTQVDVRQVAPDAGGVIVYADVAAHLQHFRAERLLVATGRRPNTEALAIEKSGVVLDDTGAVRVNEFLQTNILHVFAAGDVIGRETHSQMATPVGSQDGGIAAHNALSNEALRPVSHRVIPRTIFTDPQIGLVGMTEQQGIATGHRCWCNTLPMSLVPRAQAIHDTRGLIKMVADAETDEVLGVSMVGANAGEVIHEAAMALHFHATLHDFINLLHVFPTMAEALKIAAISRFKDPEQLTCCAE